MTAPSVNSPSSNTNSGAVCYFTIAPTHSHYPTADVLDFSNHFSLETPSASPIFEVLSPSTPSEPSNPLLAARPAPFNLHLPAMDASKLLQLQTSAAYSTRPQPQPLQQDVLDLSPISDSRSSSDASNSSSRGSFSTTVQWIRCSRCHRSASLGSKDMISFGINSYYCTRCASFVGYNAG